MVITLNLFQFIRDILFFQIVVDKDLTIISAYTGWPGCTHDARVLCNSQLYHKAEQGELFSQGQHIFADNAYPLRNWLITPFRTVGDITPVQKRFNRKFSGLRQTVERAIGQLKGRFRRLREIPLHSPEDICKVIIVGCILHNVCVLCNDNIANNCQNIYQNGYHGVARRMQLLNAV